MMPQSMPSRRSFSDMMNEILKWFFAGWLIFLSAATVLAAYRQPQTTFLTWVIVWISVVLVSGLLLLLFALVVRRVRRAIGR